jgi:hypothetical protein
MASAVAVEDGTSSDVAMGDRHVQRVGDYAGPQVVGRLPADDHPGGQVDHGRSTQPALPGPQEVMSPTGLAPGVSPVKSRPINPGWSPGTVVVSARWRQA